MNRTLVKNIEYVQNGEIKHGNIFISNGIIDFCGETTDECTNIINFQNCIAIPGIIDIHTHGGNGIDINHACEDELEKLSSFYACNGVTGFLPAVLSDSEQQTKKQLKLISRKINTDLPGAQILGIHLEGPFIGKEYKGAMPPQFLINPDIELFNKYRDVSQNSIRIVTISPELKGAVYFTEKASEEGIVVSIGHSGASYEEAISCIEAGAKSATHTMNAMKPIHQHKPGILTAVLERDIFCEAICDGFHLHPAIVRLLLKVKGIGGMISVTDSIMAAGLEDGEYVLGANKVYVKNSDATLEDGTRAGSTLTGIKALKNLIGFTGLPVNKIIPVLTENPAKLLGLQNRKGKIEPGYDADITILDKELNVKAVFISGIKKY
jgi:N-acetylglucosamine-6-phosphate deacetylase